MRVPCGDPSLPSIHEPPHVPLHAPAPLPSLPPSHSPSHALSRRSPLNHPHVVAHAPLLRRPHCHSHFPGLALPPDCPTIGNPSPSPTALSMQLTAIYAGRGGVSLSQSTTCNRARRRRPTSPTLPIKRSALMAAAEHSQEWRGQPSDPCAGGSLSVQQRPIESAMHSNQIRQLDHSAVEASRHARWSLPVPAVVTEPVSQSRLRTLAAPHPHQHSDPRQRHPKPRGHDTPTPAHRGHTSATIHAHHSWRSSAIH